MWPKYRNFDEFERDEIRPGLRVGWSLDNINDPSSIELDFDEDPFERALLESEQDDDDSEEAEYGDAEAADFAGDGEDAEYQPQRDSDALFSSADGELSGASDNLDR